MIQWSQTWLCILQLSSILTSTSPFVTAWPLLIPLTNTFQGFRDRKTSTRCRPPAVHLRAFIQSTRLSISQLLRYSHSQELRNFAFQGANWWRGLFSTQSEGIQSCIPVCVLTFGFICCNSAMKCRGFRVCNSLFTFRVLGGLWKQSVARQRDDSDVATGVSFGVASSLSWS